MAFWNVKILLPLAFLFCACVQTVGGNAMILSEDFAKFTEKKVIEEGHVPFFKGNGLCMHSSYVVKNAKIYNEKGTVHVNIEIIPVTSQTRASGLSGNFSFKIPLTPDVSQIVFGEKNAVIWQK